MRTTSHMPQDPTASFGIPALPEPQIPAEIFATQEADDMLHAGFIDLLDILMVPPANAMKSRRR